MICTQLLRVEHYNHGRSVERYLGLYHIMYTIQKSYNVNVACETIRNRRVSKPVIMMTTKFPMLSLSLRRKST